MKLVMVHFSKRKYRDLAVVTIISVLREACRIPIYNALLSIAPSRNHRSTAKKRIRTLQTEQHRQSIPNDGASSAAKRAPVMYDSLMTVK